MRKHWKGEKYPCLEDSDGRKYMTRQRDIREIHRPR